MPTLPTRRPWWAIGSLTVGTLWLLFVGCLFVTGYSATVTVTGGSGDGFCGVVWEGPSGKRLSGESDCYNEPVGSTFEVRVSGWPDAGEPTLVETYVGMGLMFGVPPVLIGAGRLLQLARRGRIPAMPHLATPAAPAGSGGALRDVRTSAAFRRVRQRAWALTVLGLVGASGIVLTMVVDISADDALRADGETTVGTVTHVEPDSKWNTGAASVRFTADGVTRTREVVLGTFADDYSEGDEVTVWFDPVEPDRFIIDDALYGEEWTSWLLVPSVVLTTAGLPFGISLGSRVKVMRRLLVGGSWEPLLTQMHREGECWDFTSLDGSRWRGTRYVVELGWKEFLGWDGFLDEEAQTPDCGSPAWWVSDGTTAVVSPDRGNSLVVAQRRHRGSTGVREDQ